MDNKTLIDQLSKESGIRRENVQELLNEFYALTAECCLLMDSIIIPGFGQFEPKRRRERITIHPSTGKRLMVPPKVVINFRPSAVLKSKLSDMSSQGDINEE